MNRLFLILIITSWLVIEVIAIAVARTGSFEKDCKTKQIIIIDKEAFQCKKLLSNNQGDK